MRKLLETILKLKQISFPNNKLKKLYSSLFKGHYQSILDTCYVKSRLSEQHGEVMKEIIREYNLTMFPWEETDTNKYATPFGDIVELYEFIH